MTGEVKRSICGVCSFSCILDVAVKDGRAVKISRVTDPAFAGLSNPCVRGAAVCDYVGHADRVKTPLRRVGAKGEGKFEEISWDEALSEISGRLLGFRKNYGSDSVAFYSGFTKWYRPYLQRLAYSFGSVNYGTESSSCFRSTTVAQQVDTGFIANPDFENAGVLLSVARGTLAPPVRAAAERGMKLITIDVRETPDIEKYSSLYLRPIPGTDAAIAHCIAKLLIDGGAADMEYIAKHVHGFEQYGEYVSAFDPATVERLTGVPASDMEKAARLIIDNAPLAVLNGFTGMIHHLNGCQTYRAFECLTAVTGSYGKSGGNLPECVLNDHGHPNTSIRSYEFAHETKPIGGEKIGKNRYPLWDEVTDEFQAMDLPRHIREQGPYPLKAVFALGMNGRMFPDSENFLKTLDELEFFVDADLFLTDTAKHADIVLPAAASFERDWLATVGMDKYLYYVPAIVSPEGSARSDEDIVCELAKAMELDDPLLCAGKRACRRFMLSGIDLTLDEAMSLDRPYRLPPAEHQPQPLRDGFKTPTGKFELYSEIIAKYPTLRPLPEFSDFLGVQPEDYPLLLMAGIRGSRYAHAFHSRTHRVEKLRRLRPDPAMDINPHDAQALGLEKGCDVILSTPHGGIAVKADIDAELRPGTVNMYHGYSEADVNTLIPADYTDPYTGFPGYKALWCKIEKVQKEPK